MKIAILFAGALVAALSIAAPLGTIAANGETGSQLATIESRNQKQNIDNYVARDIMEHPPPCFKKQDPHCNIKARDVMEHPPPCFKKQDPHCHIKRDAGDGV